MSATAPKLFVSYRRQGTAIHAGRLYDALAARFGDPNVFMDLEMAPGVDFVERITSAVGSCRVALVVMGPDWAGDDHGRSRLADPQDFVRLEVQTALEAADVIVIPVLVAGARMPRPDELPPELRPLARRNAFDMTDLKWRYDCTRLMAALDELLSVPPTTAGADGGPPPARSVEPVPPRASASVRTLAPLWLEGVAVAVAAGLLSRELLDFDGTVGRRAVVWAVVGGALALWLSLRRGDQGRLLQRTVLGLLLGALAGGLGGVVFDLLDHNTGAEVASIALTGSILGLALGALWIPPRAVAGLLSGACGGALVQLVLNAQHDLQSVLGVELEREVIQVGWQCLAIFGLTLLVLLALDVRAASAAPPGEPAPQAVGA